MQAGNCLSDVDAGDCDLYFVTAEFKRTSDEIKLNFLEIRVLSPLRMGRN